MLRHSSVCTRAVCAASLVIGFPLAAAGQIVRDPGGAMPATGGSVSVQTAMRAQSDFESFRFDNLPGPTGHGSCPEHPRDDCYWADAVPPRAPAEPAAIRDRREQLLRTLDTLAVNAPGDRWAVEQRVRYLEEAGRPDSALSAARACRVTGWACDVLIAFALHELGRYVPADSTFAHALAQMTRKERCDWRGVDLLIDDDLQRQYARLTCGDSSRAAFEDRIWYYARTLYSLDGNDSRTEHYARKTMDMMLHDAPDMLTDPVLRPNFDMSERILEMYLQYGWPRAWAISRGVGLPGFSVGGIGLVRSWRLFPFVPRPAYRYVPVAVVLNNPSMSDSSDWRLQPPPSVGGSSIPITRNGRQLFPSANATPFVARYAPPYAASLTPLEHQKAMFRRGDSALVVVAYDARVTKPLAGGKLTAALVVTPNEKPADYGKIVHDAPETGALVVRAPWGPLLMSAEVYAPDKQAVARARYGISPPFSVGTRVTLSDLLFYKPYGRFPASVEDALPHALSTERVMANERLGVYWESYGTDPDGEKMKVSLTVLREVEESGTFNRKSVATPVIVSVEDLSAMGKNITARALEVDISTLKKGSYIVQLEIEVAGQYVVRAEHRIEIIGP
jgi:hypothetical protein